MSEATAILRHDSAERRRATYQDVLDAPPIGSPRLLTACSTRTRRPAMRHAHASSSLGTKIGGPFHHDAGGPGGWWIIDEPELHLGEDILVPDLAGWRRERMPVFPDAPYAMLAPDWVCEVLSPSTRKLDLHGKRAALWARTGGSFVARRPRRPHPGGLRAARGRMGAVATAQDDAPVRIRPFDAVTFSLRRSLAAESRPGRVGRGAWRPRHVHAGARLTRSRPSPANGPGQGPGYPAPLRRIFAGLEHASPRTAGENPVPRRRGQAWPFLGPGRRISPPPSPRSTCPRPTPGRGRRPASSPDQRSENGPR